MPLSPGAILFTANFTSNAAAPQTHDETFSFIATEFIPSGTVIRFWDADSSPNYFDYTVGPNGLNALDRVTIAEDGNTAYTLHDPSYASPGVSGLSAMGGSGTSFTLSSSDPLMASSDQGGGAHEVIAAISNGHVWDEHLASTGVGRSLVDAYGGSPTPVISNYAAGTVSGASTNLMFAGTDLSGYNDPANWVGEFGNIDHETGLIGSTTYASQDVSITCFLAGSLILTPSGEQAVENLAISDKVVTADGRTVGIKWIGRQTIMPMFGLAERNLIVEITSGALGEQLPHCDLRVTADHGMVLEGLVINASALVNGDTIRVVPNAELEQRFTVYHIETENHDVIVANGAASETFIDYAGRRLFDNYDEYETLFGADNCVIEMSLPRISSARLLPDHVRMRIGATCEDEIAELASHFG